MTRQGARIEMSLHSWIGIIKRRPGRNGRSFLSQGSAILMRGTNGNGTIDRMGMRAEIGIVSRGIHHGRAGMNDSPTANPRLLYRTLRRQTNRSAMP